jgi:hypothetical protein
LSNRINRPENVNWIKYIDTGRERERDREREKEGKSERWRKGGGGYIKSEVGVKERNNPFSILESFFVLQKCNNLRVQINLHIIKICLIKKFMNIEEITSNTVSGKRNQQLPLVNIREF